MSAARCPVCGARSTVTLEWRDGKWVCAVECPACGSSSVACHDEPGEARRRAVGVWESIEAGRRPRYWRLVTASCTCLSVAIAGAALAPMWGVGALSWAFLTVVGVACLGALR